MKKNFKIGILVVALLAGCCTIQELLRNIEESKVNAVEQVELNASEMEWKDYVLLGFWKTRIPRNVNDWVSETFTGISQSPSEKLLTSNWFINSKIPFLSLLGFKFI